MRREAIIALALLLAGCAVIDPQVNLRSGVSPCLSGCGKSQKSGVYTLAGGIEYAHEAQHRYGCAISQHNWFRGTLGLAVIGVGAAALGLGLTGGSDAAITALGVSGAGLFGAGTFLSAPSRNRIYSEGIKAIGCALDAVPTLASEKTTDLRTSLEHLAPGIVRCEAGIANLEATLRANRTSASAADAAALLLKANAFVTQARAVFAAGTVLSVELDAASSRLVAAVDRIAADLNIAIGSTLPTLESAGTIVTGLAASRQQLVPVPANAAVQTAHAIALAQETNVKISINGNSQDALQKAMGVLSTEIIDTGQHVLTIATLRDVVGTLPSQALASCGVDIAKLQLPMLIMPEGPISISKANGGTQRLDVVQGKPPYVAELLEAPITGLSVTQPTPFGSRIVVTAEKGKVLIDKANLLILDGAGERKLVEIQIR